MFHYLQNLSPDDQYFDDLYHSEKSNAFLISTISDYDLGGEGDLFKAPEPIIEPLVTLDHMTSAMSMIMCEEEVISHESLQSDYFTSNLLYEYKDILAEETSTPLEVLNFELPITKDDMEENLHTPEKITKSASSISLSSVDGAQSRASRMNFNEIELKKVHGMRRVSSEGYIKPQLIDHNTETRMEKLSRYRDKKTRRNFGRKIKENVGRWSTTDKRKVCQDRRNRYLDKKVIKCALLIIGNQQPSEILKINEDITLGANSLILGRLCLAIR